MKPYLLKGKQIGVEGHLKQDRWKDQQGNNRSKISIVAENVQLLGGKNEDSTQNAGGNYQQQSFTPKANTQYQTPPAPPSDDEFPEDIPF